MHLVVEVLRARMDSFSFAEGFLSFSKCEWLLSISIEKEKEREESNRDKPVKFLLFTLWQNAVHIYVDECNSVA